MIVPQQHPEIGEIRVIGNPIRMSITPPTYRTPPPALGANTETILADLGFRTGEIAKLREEGVV